MFSSQTTLLQLRASCSPERRASVVLAEYAPLFTVGKLQRLRSRVRSYCQRQTAGGEVHRIRGVIDRLADVEYTLTDSVSEALVLEGNLITRCRPRPTEARHREMAAPHDPHGGPDGNQRRRPAAHRQRDRRPEGLSLIHI